MSDYSPNERLNIILLGECQQNYRRAAALYHRRFSFRKYLDHTVIRKVVNMGRRGFLHRQRRRYEIDNHYLNNPQFLTVLVTIHLDFHVSLRSIQRLLGVPKSTASRYLKLAKYYPYHISHIKLDREKS